MVDVSKFGGSSMATGERIMWVARIVEANPERQVVVVSAPGKLPGYLKMTDLLIHNHMQACTERVAMLVNDLGLSLRTMHVVMGKLFALQEQQSEPARVSFGEWLSAYLLSQITHSVFVDASDVIFFDGDQVRVEIPWPSGERVIIPGFYGYDVRAQSIRTFPRGGSDITASLIAERVGAKLCENWTDVPGVFDKDPNCHDDAVAYEELSYTQLLQVAHGGAQIFHPEAIAPLQTASIPLRIRSTFAPHAPGTLVT